MSKKTPLKYYSISEINNVVSKPEIIFKPRGMCVFRADLQFKCGTLVSNVIIESGKKSMQKTFAKSSQKIIEETKKEFIHKVTAAKLDALLSGDAALLESLNNEPIRGSYTAYVVE
jgi:hypothetical protein